MVSGESVLILLTATVLLLNCYTYYIFNFLKLFFYTLFSSLKDEFVVIVIDIQKGFVDKLNKV